MPAKARKLTLKQRHDHLLEAHATTLETLFEQGQARQAADKLVTYFRGLAERHWTALQTTIEERDDARRLAAERLTERQEVQLKLGDSIRREAKLTAELAHNREQLIRMSHYAVCPPAFILQREPRAEEIIERAMERLNAWAREEKARLANGAEASTRPGAINRVIEVEAAPEEPKTARVWWVLAWASVVSAVCGIINVAHTVH